VGSLVEGAAAVSVAVGSGTAAGVPLVLGVSVLLPAVVPPFSFLVNFLKIDLSLSMASSAAEENLLGVMESCARGGQIYIRSQGKWD